MHLILEFATYAACAVVGIAAAALVGLGFGKLLFNMTGGENNQ
ncbi:hypothetical protein [Shinella zoogloeoides]|nr:hypothetical protein [Shinella zoogloeoides]WLR90908.1 hypothetical protein Q9316_00595 [Shinella zoogloeoides]